MREKFRVRQFSWDLLTICLLLWSTYVSFWSYRGFPLPHSATLTGIAILSTLGLLFALPLINSKRWRRGLMFGFLVCLFFDSQLEWFDGILAFAAFGVFFGLITFTKEKSSLILSTGFSVFLLTSFLVPFLNPYQEISESRITNHSNFAAQEKDRNQPSKVIHLILDAHIGIDALPEDIEGGIELKQDLKAFYLENGFSFYSQAFSNHPGTINSVPSLLNFRPTYGKDRGYYGRRPYILKENSLFEAYARKGYAVRVYQSRYFDYCLNSPVDIESCSKYRHDGTDWIFDTSLDFASSVILSLNVFVDVSQATRRIFRWYLSAGDTLRQINISLPSFTDWSGRTSSAAAGQVLSRMIEDVVRGPKDTLYFAHLLIPHDPYILAASCEPRHDVTSWSSNSLFNRDANTEESRRSRYKAYFDQLRCVYFHLQELLDRLEETGQSNDVKIVLHSDHGARISINKPNKSSEDSITQTDLRDMYVAHFAFRGPNTSANYNKEPFPVWRLVQGSLDSNFNRPPTPEDFQIYLGSDQANPWIVWPWGGVTEP